MKHSILLVAILATTLTSCGNSIDDLARKTADLTCKAQKNAKKAMAGDLTVADESAKISTDLTTLEQEFKDKYKTEADQKKFDETFLKDMANCK